MTNAEGSGVSHGRQGGARVFAFAPLVALALLTFAIVILPAISHALILLPTANLTIVTNTDREDATFHIDLRNGTQGDPIFHDYNAFDLQTENTSASEQATLVFPQTTLYELSEVVPQDWTLASVQCTSDLPGATFSIEPNGVIMSVAENSNTTCTFSNAKAVQSPPACTQDCFSNVLFLPGIEASRLYRPDGAGGEKKVWEPGSDSDASLLTMNPDGSSANTDIYTRDVIDNAYVPIKGNVYASLIADMNALQSSGKINDWEPTPYDWRLSLDQILAGGSQSGTNISYLTTTDTPFVIQELKRLAQTSKTGKVTIVAHSNGGLVAKALMQKLGDDETAKLIDKVIFVAVPQAGTPSAVAGLLHGYKEGIQILGSTKITDASARQVGDTMPGLYTLIPSASYFTYVDDPIFTFSTSSLSDWATRYGSVVHSQETQHAFLTDSVGRTQPAATDLNDPTVLSDPLLTQAESLHQSLDAWTPPASVQVIQIAGWGVPTTVSGIDYARTLENNILTVAPNPRFVIDGDGTVVVPSALWVSTTTGAVDYWMNLKRYSDDNWLTSLGGSNGLAPYQHATILETATLRNFIVDLITNNTKTLTDYSYLSTDAPVSVQTRLRYALHSPLTLNLYDSQGHHTGISTTTGEIDEDVPGSYYTEFGDVKYIFADGSAPTHILMDGYGNGTFTFNVDQFAGDTIVASTTFKDIPTTPDTIATIDTNSDVSSLAPLHVDENGDGTTDFSISPKLNDTATADTVPPEVIVSPNLTTKDLLITGMDDISSTTVTKTGTTATIADTAGNTTMLTFQKTFNGKLLTYAKIASIKYGGDAPLALPSSFTYIWDAKQNLISQTVVVDKQFIVEALFDPKKNKTIIVILKKGSPIQTQIVVGLALVKLTTNKGTVGYGW